MVHYLGSIILSKLCITSALESGCPLSIIYYDRPFVNPLLKLYYFRQYHNKIDIVFFLLFVVCHKLVTVGLQSPCLICLSSSAQAQLCILIAYVRVYFHIFYQIFQLTKIIDFLLFFVFFKL